MTTITETFATAETGGRVIIELTLAADADAAAVEALMENVQNVAKALHEKLNHDGDYVNSFECNIGESRIAVQVHGGEDCMGEVFDCYDAVISQVEALTAAKV